MSKPFNFEAWKTGAKVMIECGLAVEDLIYFPLADSSSCLAGTIRNSLKTWSINGKSNEPHHPDQKLNLVMSPVKRKASFYIDHKGIPVGIGPDCHIPVSVDGHKVHTVEVEE